jgi:mono/diheme cytochrome c family protein
MRSIVGLAAVGLALAVGLIAGAQNSAPTDTSVVAGYEHLRDSLGESREAGATLLGELNCLSCHVADSGTAAYVDTKPAPDLRSIGARAGPGWIRDFVLDPQATKPGTTMPAMLDAVAPASRAALADDLTHFLMQQSSGAAPPAFEAFRFRAAVQRGRELFHTVGCVACHTPEDETPMPADVPLPDLTSKTHVEALAGFLLDPEATRYASRMPALHLAAAEATDLAVYLLRDQEPARAATRPGFEFEYFLHPPEAEGFELDNAIDLDAYLPVRVGVVDRLTLADAVTQQSDNHSVRFSGLVRIEEAGQHRFTVDADRQAYVTLRIGDRIIATKERGSLRAATGDAALPAGAQPVEVEYHLAAPDDPARLGVTVATPSTGPRELGRVTVHEAVQLQPVASVWTVDPASAARGREAFARVGCVSCHALASAPTAVAPDRPALPLAQLAGMAPDWSHGAASPRYALDARQRATLAHGVDALTDGEPPSEVEQLLKTLATYNCLACHERADGDFAIGGPRAERQPHFRIVGDQDLGDEGRFPPTLTAVGGKLQQEAIASILREDRLHIRRDYMHTRMPRFGGATVAALPALFANWDAWESDRVVARTDAATIEAGLQLVGADGLRCIACHDVGAGRTYGISVANLSLAHERLRPQWLDGFLRDPAAINTGTRMPQYWVDDGVIFDDVAGGTVDGQIEAIWSYLALGASMPLPTGMNLGDTLVLVPDDEPIVFRTFMRDASPRAITVGHPEGVHGAFDANVQRLVKVWRGAFFDAKGTWSGRAGQFFGPQGSDVLEMPPGPAIAVLEARDAPWPQAALTDRDVGGEFRGYRYDELRRPSFEYVLNETLITETLVPVVSVGGTNVIRRFTVETASATAPHYLLAAEGVEINPTDDGWDVDGRWQLVIRGADSLQPFVRRSQGATQLLIPIPPGSAQPIVIDLEIQW